MPLDDPTKALLDELAGGDEELTVEGMRAFGIEMARRWGEGPDMARVVRHGATIELVPHGESRALIVFFHGGGWVAGAPGEIETLGQVLADRARCTVVLPGYRLAPEHPFPAAVEDAVAAVRWAAERAAGLPLIVAGDSAGGNLAAVVAQRTDGPAIALQVLIEPVTDTDTETASYLDPENQLVVTRELMQWFLGHYAPDPTLAPLRAPNLAGAPPAVVLTAEHDVLRDEGEAYVARLREAGVDVSHKRFEGQMHGFFGMIGVLPGSAAGLEYVVDAIDRYCAV
ncbi:alpha/beta hydrolase [Solirubrobacter soli]|uniref:alpha/beta hydrolase n=1 Tax=Solirubrobacter soli TaxID=363832 RepID=UPI000429456E|nr:alpha/beta hydrolase [Solirubrobacter soli]